MCLLGINLNSFLCASWQGGSTVGWQILDTKHHQKHPETGRESFVRSTHSCFFEATTLCAHNCLHRAATPAALFSVAGTAERLPPTVLLGVTLKLFLQRKEKTNQLHWEQAQTDVTVWKAKAKPSRAGSTGTTQFSTGLGWSHHLATEGDTSKQPQSSSPGWDWFWPQHLLPRVCRHQLTAGLTEDGGEEMVKIWEENAGRAGWLKPAMLGFTAEGEGEKGNHQKMFSQSSE